jgi:hypothetical protein
MTDHMTDDVDGTTFHGWDVVQGDYRHGAFADTASPGDHVELSYVPKNGGDVKVASGIVSRVAGERVIFRRHDDDHLMYVDGDGLHTGGSHHPFMGRVTSVLLEVRD